MISWNLPTIVAVPIALGIGGLIGAWHGFWIAYVKIPAFIVTLAGMLLFRGLTMIVLDGRTIAPFPDNFRTISSSYLPDFLNGGENIHLLTLVLGILAVIVYVFLQIQSRNQSKQLDQTVESDGLFYAKIILISLVLLAFTQRLTAYAGVPYILLILIVLIFGYTFFTNRCNCQPQMCTFCQITLCTFYSKIVSRCFIR
ncbi:hypothetical protein B795N_21540 [Marinilactibacillus psychrotolerans]|uniref:hypothetical protein n=1 Tax=Marinilactibacillus psychrotolerans TaxID=191770 RepID=UPI001C7CAD80|nr:hypothetical protein [Marinilactibacillus psychrotolerans]GEQ34272.1 hypothetical protein B795N_21540 [Marinilactibacillus psychrotolerans]